MFPRASVISDHAHKVFVPNTHLFTNPSRGGLTPAPKPTEPELKPKPSHEAALAAAQDGGAAPPHDGSLVDEHPVEEADVLGHAHLQGHAKVRDCFVHAGVDRITPTHVVLDRKLDREEYDEHKSLEDQLDESSLDEEGTTISWDYLVYVGQSSILPKFPNWLRR